MEDEVATYHGEYVSFDQVRCDPSPANGTVPLHIGGASPAAVRRAAKYGDGYFPWVGPGLDLHATLRQVIGDVRVEAERFGRDPDSIEYTVGGARTVAEAEADGGARRRPADDRDPLARSSTPCEDELGSLRRRGDRRHPGSVKEHRWEHSTGRWRS